MIFVHWVGIYEGTEREAFIPTANVSHVPPLAFAFTFAYIALIDFFFFYRPY